MRSGCCESRSKTIDCAQDTEDQRALLSLVSGTRMLERGEWLGHLVCGG